MVSEIRKKGVIDYSCIIAMLSK